MSQSFLQLVNTWLVKAGQAPLSAPVNERLAARVQNQSIRLCSPASAIAIRTWETSHGLFLPESVKAWLAFSNGLIVDGYQWIHSLRSIGPTVRFSPSSRLLLQPATWYEFGNPHENPVNLDILTHYKEAPVFIVGDESHNDPPRIIARNFTDWFRTALETNFNRFWHDPAQFNLGDPVQSHYLRRDPVKLSPKLCKLCSIVGDELIGGGSEYQLMKSHQINRDELELIIDVYQYRRVKEAQNTTH